jgi:hypothetical protein
MLLQRGGIVWMAPAKGVFLSVLICGNITYFLPVRSHDISSVPALTHGAVLESTPPRKEGSGTGAAMWVLFKFQEV